MTLTFFLCFMNEKILELHVECKARQFVFYVNFFSQGNETNGFKFPYFMLNLTILL